MIDVGAHVGYFALLAGHANREARVYAFEPFRLTYERLKRHIALNRLTNVQGIASAVGKIDGQALFFSPSSAGIPSSARLSREMSQAWGDQVVTSIVPVVTIDSFVKQERLGRVDLVKIDTEGSEPEVLHGAEQTLKRDHPIIFAEVLRTHTGHGLEEILGPLGYHYYSLTSQGCVVRDHIASEYPPYLNHLFTVLDPPEIAMLLV